MKQQSTLRRIAELFPSIGQMAIAENNVNISFDNRQYHMDINYICQSNRSLYDICNLNGRILKTGRIESGKATVSISELENESYILLILDGNQMKSLKFTIER